MKLTTNQKMPEDNLIHVKIDYDEAFSGKKDILSSEIYMLKIAGNIERYKSLRAREFSLKENLHKKLKNLKLLIKNLEKILPKPDVPRISRRVKKEHEEYEPKQETAQKEKHKNDIEYQLFEIQKRLDQLQRRNV